MFKKMDSDSDGIVSIEELKSGLQNVGSQLAESEVQMLIEAVSDFSLDFIPVSLNSLFYMYFTWNMVCCVLQQQHCFTTVSKQQQHCFTYVLVSIQTADIDN